jgi:hypothetical protein
MGHRQADVASLRMLRKARDRIDRDYREEIGIEALARAAGYSREHFIRAFRAAYGETPGRYRTRRRVERARELLRSANLTVTEICYLVAKGALSPGVIATSDCRGDYEVLARRGVEFTQPPAERPYGIEAVLRDDSGNWFSFTQRTA